MRLRSCLGCGAFTEDRYCDECEPKQPKRQSFRERYPDWSNKTKAVLKRDHHKCHWCGADATSADHLIPRSISEDHSLSNLVAACQFCNHNRNNLSVSKWLRSPILAQRRQEVSSARRSNNRA